MRFSKRKKVMLYKAFKQNQEIQKLNNERTKRTTDMSIKKTSTVKEKKKKQEIIHSQIGPICISICSISNEIGCSYLSLALAKYLKKTTKKDICVVSNDLNINGFEIISIHSLNEDINLLYDKFQYIIFDLGMIQNLQQVHVNELRRSNLKLMMARIDSYYIDKLAIFIKEQNEIIDKWKFIFNYVPKEKIKKINDLMEDYEHYCLPLFDCENLDKETTNIFDNLLRGKEH